MKKPVGLRGSTSALQPLYTSQTILFQFFTLQSICTLDPQANSLSRLKTVGVDSSRDGKLGGGVTYELQYRSRVGQDWVLVPTKTPNKILTGLLPRQLYDFKVRALNSAGWGEFSPTIELQMPSERKRGGDEASETTD